MASSTPASSRRGIPSSQGNSRGQSLSSILGVDPSSSSFTCVGYATSSNGNRCRRSINTSARITAKSLLLAGDCKLEAGQDLRSLLSELASCVLCQSYHIGQAPTIVAEWSRKVSAYKDSTQNSPSSSERASAIRALPSARNNLSSYARVEPDISSPATESRQHNSEKEPGSPATRPPGNTSSSRSHVDALVDSRHVVTTGPFDAPSSRNARAGQATSASSPNQYGDLGRGQRTPYYLRSPEELGYTIFTGNGEHLSTVPVANLPRTPTSTPTRAPARAETSSNHSISSRTPTSVSTSSTGAESRQTPTSSSTTNSRASVPSPTPTPRQGTGNGRPRSNAAPPPPHIHDPTPGLSSNTTATHTNPPPVPSSWGNRYYYPYHQDQSEATRRSIKGDCSICYESLATAPDPWDKEKKENNDGFNPLVWCRAECGVNFHRSCFDCWRKACVYLKCPNCRALWKY